MNKKDDSSTDPRIYMVAERTFLAWIRTGKALDRGQFRQAYGAAFSFLVAGFLAIIGLAVAIYLAVLL